MNGIRHVAVIDIGKTNAKVALVDLDNLTEIAVSRTSNTIRHDGDLSALRRRAPVGLHSRQPRLPEPRVSRSTRCR